jgi:hypothetical protein
MKASVGEDQGFEQVTSVMLQTTMGTRISDKNASQSLEFIGS